MSKSSIINPGQFALCATFQAKEGKFAEMKEVMKISYQGTLGAEGLLQAYLFEPQKEQNPFVFTAVWESKKHFSEFMKSPKTKEMHSSEYLSQLQEAAMAKATAEMYSVAGEWHVPH